MFDYLTWQIFAILATYLFASVAKGVTGLGFSTVCLPFLAIIVGMKEALPLIIIPSVVSNLVVMRQVGAFRETLTRFWPMLLATVPGLVLGLWLLSAVDGRQAGGILGTVLILWCGFSYLKADLRLPDHLERPLAPVSGFLTGLINGVTGSQVMPSMPFLMSLHLPRNVFIQAINCSFTLSSMIMAVGLGQQNLFTTDSVLISMAGALVALWGLRTGERIRNHLSPEKFRLVLLLMLTGMGLTMVLRSV